MENISSPADLQDSAHTCLKAWLLRQAAPQMQYSPEFCVQKIPEKERKGKGVSPKWHAAQVKGRWVEKARALKQRERCRSTRSSVAVRSSLHECPGFQ